MLILGLIKKQHISLIFFVDPGPKGSEENQFTPPGDGVKKLIFEPR